MEEYAIIGEVKRFIGFLRSYFDPGIIGSQHEPETVKPFRIPLLKACPGQLGQCPANGVRIIRAEDIDQETVAYVDPVNGSPARHFLPQVDDLEDLFRAPAAEHILHERLDFLPVSHDDTSCLSILVMYFNSYRHNGYGWK
jgi:hypothetical protein